jgi:N-carbamoyl-L-amino-acid hydrolase
MLFATMEKQAASIAIETKTKISFERKPMNQNQHWLIKLCSKPLKDQPKQWIKYIHASGAGRLARNSIDCSNHDFVTSVGGISHSPKEFTKSIDMANGANVFASNHISTR